MHASESMPPQSLLQAAPEDSPSLNLSPTRRDAVKAGAVREDVHHKVSAMLAATQALKPSPDQSLRISSADQSKGTSSKILTKVSQAWDKVYSKQPRKGHMHSKSVQIPVNMWASPWKSPHQECSDGHMHDASKDNTSLSTFEIRLNEGNNLNKRKVQKIVGGQVLRKPVADDGKSLQSRASTSETTDDRSYNLVPEVITSSEAQCRAQQRGSAPPSSAASRAGWLRSLPPPVPISENPFDLEEDFFKNYDKGILTASPVASSTPQTHRKRKSVVGSTGSPTNRRHFRGQSEGIPLISKPCTEPTLGYQALSGPVGAVNPRPDNVTARRRFGHIIPRVKKHPSPSKCDLESMHAALAHYSSQKDFRVWHDDTDELVDSSRPMEALRPLDGNQVTRRQLCKQEIAGSKLINSSHARRSVSVSQVLGSGHRGRTGAAQGQNMCLRDEDELHDNEHFYGSNGLQPRNKRHLHQPSWI